MVAQREAEKRAWRCSFAPLLDAICEARRRHDFAETGRLLWKAKALVPRRRWQAWLATIGLPYQHAKPMIRGFRCIVVVDCCGSYFPEFHEMGPAMIKP
jgi:hypothetical protein